MALKLFEAGKNATLDGFARALDGGSIEMLGAEDQVLAVLQLPNPSAPPADGGKLDSTRSPPALPPHRRGSKPPTFSPRLASSCFIARSAIWRATQSSSSTLPTYVVVGQ